MTKQINSFANIDPREDVNMKGLLVVFSHGKESGAQGSKIRALAKVAE